MDARLDHLCRTEGCFLYREARALGYDDRTIYRLVRDGQWRRVRHGAFTLRAYWDGLDDKALFGLRCQAAYRQAKTEVAFSHRSGAFAHGTPLWDVDLSTIDLTRLDARTGRNGAGIVQHRGKVLSGDLVGVGTRQVMSPARIALELTTQLDVEHSLVEIDDLLHRQLTTVDALRERFTLMNSWPDTLHTDLVLRLVDGRSESVGETRVRYLCWSQHLPAPELNYEVRDRWGRVVGRVDFAWPELGLFVEFDGKEKYLRYRRPGESIADCVERERRREVAIIEATGWRVIRLIWADLYRPAETAERIRSQFRATAA